MQVTLSQWEEALSNLQIQIDYFNNGVKNDINLEEISDIKEKVNAELYRLSELGTWLTQRKEELSRGCYVFSRRKVALITIAGYLTVALQGVELGLLYYPPNLTWEKIGFSCGTVSLFFAFMLNHYNSKVTLKTGELAGLSEFNQKSIEDARIFKEFIEKFEKMKAREQAEQQLLNNIRLLHLTPHQIGTPPSKETRLFPHIEETELKASESIDHYESPQPVYFKRRISLQESPPLQGSSKLRKSQESPKIEIIDADQSLEEIAQIDTNMESLAQDCLKTYTMLPQSSRTRETYSSIVSVAIHSLSRNHSLRQGLDNLERNAQKIEQKPHIEPINDYGIGNSAAAVNLQGESGAPTGVNYHKLWNIYTFALIQHFQIMEMPIFLKDFEGNVLTENGLVSNPDHIEIRIHA